MSSEVAISPFETVYNVKRFIETNSNGARNYKGWLQERYLSNLRKLLYVLENNKYEPYLSAKMERKDMILAINQLLYNHRRVIAFDSEYSSDKYDFLVAEKKINLTNEQKKTIFAESINIYREELNDIMINDSGRSKMAETNLDQLNNEIMTDHTKRYLAEKSKVIALRRYLDGIKEAEIKFD